MEKGKRLRVVGTLLSTAALLAVLLPASASAAPQLLSEFGQDQRCMEESLPGGCGAAGETNVPRGFGVDPRNGHLFVADAVNHRVDEFTPWGGFVKAFGWDVAPGGVDEEQEVRVRAGAGQFKLSFGADTTPDLPFDATATEVEVALDALPSIGAGGGGVHVEEARGVASGATPYIYIVRFEGPSLEHSDVAQLSASDGSTPLSGGDPSTSLEVITRANGTPSGTGLEACTTASHCREGVGGVGAGQLSESVAGLAVASNGDVYLAEVQPNERIQKFTSSGEFLWMVGGGVDQGPNHPGNLCTAAFVAAGDTCGPGSQGSEAGEFIWGAFYVSSLIAVGTDGTVYVGDKERIQEFEPSGAFKSQVAVTGTVTSLAVTPSGELYVAGNIPQENPANGKVPVRKLDSSGATICEFQVGRPSALAADGAGGVYVQAEKVTESVTELRREVWHFDPSCTRTEAFPVNFSPQEENVRSLSIGLAVNTVGDIYLGEIYNFNSLIRAYGPGPVNFESPPPAAPEIASEYARSVSPTSAALQARINPKFWTDTTFYIEYGTRECIEGGGWEAACVAKLPDPPGASLTANATNAPVETKALELSGLQPNTRYHYRFVSVSGGGGPTVGQEQGFFTLDVPQQGLPDGRVFELVSPRFKDGGEVAVPTAAGGGAEFSVQPQQASPGGDAVSYASATAFGQDPESAPAASQYLSWPQGMGTWTTHNIDPRFEEGYLRDPIVGFSENLSHAAMIVLEPLLTPDAAEGFPNLYWRDNATGSVTAVTTREHTPETNLSSGIKDYCVSYGGTTTGSDKVFFAAKGALLPGDSKGADGFNLYEWAAARPPTERLRLVSVLPGNTKEKPATAAPANTFGFVSNPGGGFSHCDASTTLMRNAISADGSRVFWTYDGTLSGAPKPLFARLDGSESVRLDEPNAGVAGAGGEGQFWAASSDGSRVFFTDQRRLTADATAEEKRPDLYLYDFSRSPEDRLVDLTVNPGEAAGVGGVLGTSRDGSIVYLVASGVLDGGAIAGEPNLYVWRQGAGLHFIAVMHEGDFRDWTPDPSQQTARVSPDGRHVALLSRQKLSSFNSVGAAEAYLYDLDSDSFSCASCNRSGAKPVGSVSLPSWSTPYEQPRYLSDDGTRLFFESPDPLDPHDVNGISDVYEFERAGSGSCTAVSATFDSESRGCLYLLSSGRSDDASYFVDASTSGNDVFISTRERLVFTDEDERYDVYDARVGGSLPPRPPSPCEGEGCRGEATHPPAGSSPGTSGFAGPGNARPRCPKGTRKQIKKGKKQIKKGKKQIKKGKKQCVKVKGRKHRKHRKHRKYRHHHHRGVKQ